MFQRPSVKANTANHATQRQTMGPVMFVKGGISNILSHLVDMVMHRSKPAPCTSSAASSLASMSLHRANKDMMDITQPLAFCRRTCLLPLPVNKESENITNRATVVTFYCGCHDTSSLKSYLSLCAGPVINW